MKKETAKRLAAACLTAVIAASGIGCVIYRASGVVSLCDDSALAAGYAAFSGGSLQTKDNSTEKKRVKKQRGNHASAATSDETPLPKQTTHTGEAHPVALLSGGSGGLTLDNIRIRNTTSTAPDYQSKLNGELPFTVYDDHRVQVLIYHTHTCESYLDEDTGVYYDDFYPRTTNKERNVCAVGEAIARALKAHGIGVVHDTTLHDYPSYEGSYDRSWDTAAALIEKYPDICVTLDIHRDSMTADDGTKYKPVFTYHGRQAAQIMIMTGCDDGTGRFPFWDENLILALKLQKKAEDLYPGMTRPLNFGEFTYNMNLNNGSLLIEVGTDANTLEEATLSGEMLGNALSTVLQKG